MSFCESSRRVADSKRIRSVAAVFGALVLSALATTESWSQSTVVIGGSGQPAVEVNLDVLDRPEGQFPGAGRRLLMPGERPAAVVRLRAPGSSVRGAPVASSPRLKLRPPAARPVQRAAKPMPASPAPKVTQRVVSAPTPTQPASRATPLAPPSRAVRMAPPPMAEKPASPPDKAPAPQQIAAKTVPSKPTPPPPVAKTPPPPPVVKSPPPPPPPVTKAPPPPPAAKVPPPPPVVAKAPPPPVPKAPSERTAKAQTQAVQSARAPAKPSPPATQPRSKERQVAALPRVSLPRDGGQVLRIDFLGASARLTTDAERSLGSLAATMEQSDGRLQLKAYAGGTGETLSSARRLSLSRALAVRSFLIEQGIRSTRIDVRALGRAEDSGPPERVDIVLLTQ